MKTVFSGQAWTSFHVARSENPSLHESMEAHLSRLQSGEERGQPLAGSLSGWTSCRISRQERLVYRIVKKQDGPILEIAACRLRI